MLMSGGDANGALAGGCGDSFPPPVGSDRSSSSIHSRACAQIVVCQGSSGRHKTETLQVVRVCR